KLESNSELSYVRDLGQSQMRVKFENTQNVMRLFKILAPLLFVSFFAAATSKPDTVKVGAYIISIHDINFQDKEYTARFWLWFVYKNPRLNFSQQIDIPNAKEVEITSESIDTVNGQYWAQMRVKCVMKENWRVHDFPFDEQTLKII